MDLRNLNNFDGPAVRRWKDLLLRQGTTAASGGLYTNRPGTQGEGRRWVAEWAMEVEGSGTEKDSVVGAVPWDIVGSTEADEGEREEDKWTDDTTRLIEELEKKRYEDTPHLREEETTVTPPLPIRRPQLKSQPELESNDELKAKTAAAYTALFGDLPEDERNAKRQRREQKEQQPQQHQPVTLQVAGSTVLGTKGEETSRWFNQSCVAEWARNVCPDPVSCAGRQRRIANGVLRVLQGHGEGTAPVPQGLRVFGTLDSLSMPWLPLVVFVEVFSLLVSPAGGPSEVAVLGGGSFSAVRPRAVKQALMAAADLAPEGSRGCLGLVLNGILHVVAVGGGYRAALCRHPSRAAQVVCPKGSGAPEVFSYALALPRDHCAVFASSALWVGGDDGRVLRSFLFSRLSAEVLDCTFPSFDSPLDTGAASPPPYLIPCSFCNAPRTTRDLARAITLFSRAGGPLTLPAALASPHSTSLGHHQPTSPDSASVLVVAFGGFGLEY